MASRTFTGRTVLYTDEAQVDNSNIAAVLEQAVKDNEQNISDIKYLYEYFKGKQPILERTKTYNDEINNKIVENRAAEIVSFKTGYLLSAPIQYIDAANNDLTETIDTSDLAKLSKWCEMEGKSTSDLEIAQWQSICGTAFRWIFPKSDEEKLSEEDSPFEFETLDPQTTFVVYSSRMGHKPLLGVTFVTLEDESMRYYCYTDKEFFILDKDYKPVSDEIDKPGSHTMGAIPIVEYPANMSRIGDVEVVVSLLDAINNVQSNRADGVEQIIQSILCMEGMAIETGANQSQTQAESDFMKQLKEVGGLLLPEGAKAYYLTNQLNQGDTQTYKDDLYDAVLTISGMPNRNASASTGDTGSAVMLRDGWSAAESRARNTEIFFKKSERKFLNILITIANEAGGTNILPADVDIRFPRRNYTNDSANVSNLVTMLSSDWIRPEFAYEHCNMTADPHKDYLLAKEWHDNQQNETVDALASLNAEQADADEHTDEQGDTLQAAEDNVNAANNTTGRVI